MGIKTDRKIELQFLLHHGVIIINNKLLFISKVLLERIMNIHITSDKKVLEFIVSYSNEIVPFCIRILKYHITPHTYMWSLHFYCFKLKISKKNSGNQATVIKLMTMFNIFNRRLKN